MTWISKQLYQDGMGVFSRLRLFCLLHASKLYRWQCQSWSVCCGWATFDHTARNQGQILDPHINNSCTSAIASCNPRRSCMSLLGNCSGLLLSDSLPHLIITSIHSLFFFAYGWFHGAWLHFQRAKAGVSIWCSCVLNTGKGSCIESLVLKDKEAASLKLKALLYSCLLIMHLPSGSKILD